MANYGLFRVIQMTSSCPECDGRVETTSSKEDVCTECGLVVDDSCIDHGPEWRSFDDDEGSRSRVGAPSTEMLHDKGLSTKIGWQDRDANGNALTARKRKQMKRLRKWDERARTETTKERGLKNALSEIQRMASTLETPEAVRKTAADVYRDALEANLIKGRSIEGIATAALYAACRIHKIPVTLGDMAEVCRVHLDLENDDYQSTLKHTVERADAFEKKRERVKRDYRYLCKELEIPTAVPEPHRFVPRIVSGLDVSTDIETTAIRLLRTVEEQDAHSALSPVGMAAGAVYAASRVSDPDGDLTQREIIDGVAVSEVTLRKRYKEILELNGYQSAIGESDVGPDQKTFPEGDA
jgi:transcription initiation factor TFIIB